MVCMNLISDKNTRFSAITTNYDTSRKTTEFALGSEFVSTNIRKKIDTDTKKIFDQSNYDNSWDGLVDTDTDAEHDLKSHASDKKVSKTIVVSVSLPSYKNTFLAKTKRRHEKRKEYAIDHPDSITGIGTEVLKEKIIEELPIDISDENHAIEFAIKKNEFAFDLNRRAYNLSKNLSEI